MHERRGHHNTIARAKCSEARTRARGTFAAIALLLASETARAGVGVRADPRVLAWSDFRLTRSIPGGESAVMAAEISFPRPLRVIRSAGGYRLPDFTITVAPNPERTIVARDAPRTDDLLRHEQGHFDIVVLAARALARELEAVETDTPGELTRTVEEAVDEHTRRADALSREYDAATAHGQRLDAQRRWLRAIADTLREATPRSLLSRPL